MRRAAGALVLMLLTAACATSSTALGSPSPSPSVQPSAPSSPQPSASVLVFQSVQGSATHFTLARPDGSVIKTVDTTAGTGSTWQGPSAALLLYGAGGAVSVLAPDGTVTPIPTALRPYFSQNGGIGTQAGDAILVTPTLVVGTVGYDPAKFVMIDLQSGQVSTLLQAKRTAAVGGIAPPIVLNLGVGGPPPAVRILLRHADYGQVVPQWALVEIDLKQKVIVGVPNLPLAAGVDAYDAADPALSRDGSVFAYMEANSADSSNHAILRVHIAKVGSAQDIVAPDNAIRILGQEGGLSFSPDGATVVGYGEDAWPDASGTTDARLVAFATADGRTLTDLDLGDASYNMAQPVGWVGPHTLAYTVTSTNLLGDFTNGTQTAYLLDVVGGAQTQLPAGWGQLVAVLNPSAP
jgi:hypothetical protein